MDAAPTSHSPSWKPLAWALGGLAVASLATRPSTRGLGVLASAVGCLAIYRAHRAERRQLSEALVSLPFRGEPAERLAELPRTFARMEARLGELSAQLEQEDALRWNLLANLRAGVLLFRDSGRLRLFNPAARQLLGSSSHVAVGTTLAEAFREPESLRNLEAAAGGESPEWVLRRQGRTLLVRAVAIRDASGERRRDDDGLLVTLHDITRQEALETTRQKFISNASHELKTPTTSIRVAAENLMDGGMVSPEGDVNLRIILRSVDRMTLLLHDISELSRIETGALALEPAPLAVLPFSRELLEDCATQARERQVTLRLTGEACAQDLVLQADAHRLNQLLENLLNNAIKFSPAGAEVILELQRDRDFLAWAVRDQGSGISSGDLERIFERFYRAPSARAVPGTGLGLAIVKHLALLMNGEVTVQSTPGTGSTFTFRFPLR